MVVVVVLGVLLALVVPTFLEGRTRAGERASQTNLRLALTAATVQSTASGGSWDAASPEGLAGVEPSLAFRAGILPSTGPREISVQATSGTWSAAVFSGTRCFYVRVAGTGPATFGTGTVPAACTGAEGELRAFASGWASDATWTMPVTAGLSVWVDAFVTSTLTVDGSGRVSGWADRSGNARNLSQTEGALQPVFDPTGFNGRPAVVFDGTDNLSIPASVAYGSVFVVVQRGGTQQIVLELIGAGSRGVGITGDNDIFRAVDQYWLNGTPVASSPGSQWPAGIPVVVTGLRSGTVPIQTGWHGRLGHGSPSFQPLVGPIAELIVFDRVVGPTERLQVERYLAGRWGIALAS